MGWIRVKLSTILHRGAPADRGGIGRSAGPRLVVRMNPGGHHQLDGIVKGYEIRTGIVCSLFLAG
jgi:hypothetical protein